MAEHSIKIYAFSKDDHTSTPFLFLRLKERAKPLAFNPHRHNFYELFFFLKGGGYHLLDFQEFPILKHSIHFVAPGQLHAVQRDLDTEGYAILFSRDFFHQNLASKDFLAHMPFFDSHQQQIRELHESLAKEMQSYFEMLATENQKEEKEADVLRALLQIILIKCRKTTSSATKNITPKATPIEQQHYQLVQTFKKQLEQRFMEKHQVSDYADLLLVSPNHLNNTTKRITGMTASELIQERIVLEAKRLLTQGELSTKEIAYTLNFNDPSYFSRFFRKHTGQSPSSFKQLVYDKYQS